MGDKNFKDPIYGYVSIVSDIVPIIDSAVFQRLRLIKQTSYEPLYAASLHNRFVHSLGVYHLGTVVFSALQSSGCLESFVSTNRVNIIELKRTFLLACLLHDVGHAPFSHSGEEFFLVNKENPQDEGIYKHLFECVNSDDFTQDVKQYHQDRKMAAPHEIMSVIVSLRKFPKAINGDEMRELFARCITGYKFTDSANQKKSLYNVFISLLNSSTIDVDRLDYIIRDAYVMGYDSIKIDYHRLLNSATIIRNNGLAVFAYDKSALSVIENVIYAHDSVKKWIQGHPVVVYENFLIQNMIRSVRKQLQKTGGEELFTYSSLIEPRLLSDDDIISHAKRLEDCAFCSEFFDRSKRLRPIWKSEAEYRVILDGLIGDDSFPKMQEELKIIDSFLLGETESHHIDAESKAKCEEILNDIRKDNELAEKDKSTMISRYEIIQKWFVCFENIHKSQSIDFDFVIIHANNFSSGFLKADLGNTIIHFPRFGREYTLSKLISLLSSRQGGYLRDKFFYVYYRKGNQDVDCIEVGREIAKTAI